METSVFNYLSLEDLVEINKKRGIEFVVEDGKITEVIYGSGETV